MKSRILSALVVLMTMTLARKSSSQEYIQYFEEYYDPGLVTIHFIVIDRKAPNYELRILARSNDNNFLTTELQSLVNTSETPVLAAINGYTWSPKSSGGRSPNEPAIPDSTLVLQHELMRDCFSPDRVDCFIDKSILMFSGQDNGIAIDSIPGKDFSGDAYYAIGSDWIVLDDGTCKDPVSGYKARSAIGWANDRVVLFSTSYPGFKVNGGLSSWEVCVAMKLYGADNAVLLDGGPSSAIMYGNEVKNPLPLPISGLFENGNRHIANAIALVECQEYGQTCSSTEECCGGASCIAGSCTEENSACSPGSCPSGEWCQPSSGACSSCDGGCYGIHQSTCETQCGVTPCTSNCTNKCGGASDGCDSTCNGCPTAHNCENMTCVSCGGGNEPCCLQGSECYSNLTCQNGVCSSVSVSSIDDVAAGEYHTCAVVNGEARCFGNNQDGQLGNGTTSSALTPSAVKGVGGNGTLSGVLSVSAGGSHTCALLNTGKVVCWGFNPYGQLGNGSTTQSSVPVEVLGPNGNGLLSNVAEISTGDYFTCARTNGSSVYCWGRLPFGTVGGAHPEPEQLPATTNVLEISAGGEHLCLRKSDDSLWCVGDNYYGQLGNGSSSNSSLPSPVQVVAALNIPLSVQGLPKHLGTEHSCAWSASGIVECWGNAGLSQVTGTGSNICEGGNVCERKAIVAISSSGGLAVGGNHTCSLKNGVVMCWGSNSHGQVGLNAVNSCSGSNACSHQEVEVKQCGNGLPFTASQIVAGGNHTCAITSNGLMCWGRNLNGELGNGTTVNSSCPIAVSGL